MRSYILAAGATLCLAGMTSTAQASIPNGGSFSDLAPYGVITCTFGGRVVATDLIVNPGGGNVAWLPDGTEVVGTSFVMYDAAGDLIFEKTYGGTSRQQSAALTCISTGTDPDSGAVVTVVFRAVPVN
jgi:hypothetical protein